jgi:CubicO group peptidase (beta-lactamase class C family)
MMKRFLIVFLSFIILTANLKFLYAQSKVNLIDNIIQTSIDKSQLNGNVLVVEDGNVIYSKSIGMADMKWDIPNEFDTKFRIYSMTKQFTAVLVMQLVEAGKIDLQKTVSHYLPWYRKDTGEKVTVHKLLTHTHGIAGEDQLLPPFLVPDPTQQLIEKYFSNDFEFEPGSKFKYSGLLGYILLGAIIESVTGKMLREVFQENIFDPLGMKNTTYLDYRNVIKKKAADYVQVRDGYENRIQAYPRHADGSTSIVSTAGDMLIWDQALYTEKLLTRESLNQILSPQVHKVDNYYYGYGWHIEERFIGGKKKLIHNHGGGNSCYIFRNTEDNQTIILLNNIFVLNLYDIGIEILHSMN